MESPIGGYPSNYSQPFSRKSRSSYVPEWNSMRYKRAKVSSEVKDYNGIGVSQNISNGASGQLCGDASKVIDYSDPFGISKLLDSLEGGDFGSVTKEIQEIRAKRMAILNPCFVLHPELAKMGLNVGKSQMGKVSKIINLDGDDVMDNCQAPVVIIDSDDENGADQLLSHPDQLSSNPYLLPPNPFLLPSLPYQHPSFQEIFLGRPASKLSENDIMGRKIPESKNRKIGEQNMAGKMGNGKGVYVGVDNDLGEDNEKDKEDDGLGDIWKEMSVALECSKDVAGDPSSEENESEDEDCDHSFVLKDDLGYVCRICGVIQRGIETIFDFQYVKVTRLNRNYRLDSHDMKDIDPSEILPNGLKLSQHDFSAIGISAHPRHKKEMKPHQVEGFNFLVSNLVGDDPGGCILAHAPGSGKTFMIISFMQSFMAKYPHARPLVVLPKGILATWKREFQKWQVEDIPLYDFYSVKADSRVQQLEVLKQWVEEKSILFLGYKQFSSIVCGSHTNKIAAACEEILLKVPTILILDEGHTPRNENTDVLHSLAKVQTRRKVVLSGTLYQNHVKEVFNILNLVRPKFLKMDSSRIIVKRILSKVKISGIRKNLKAHADMAFYDLVEHTLQKEEDFRIKVTVIQDLREMTNKVLHYYKGDFLDELPGLEDFTVLLKVSAKQKVEVDKLKKRSEHKFKRSSVGSAIYMHPQLKHFSENIQNGDKLSSVNDANMDEMLEKIDVRDGVKAKFFLNMIGLCESAGEKLLVFSQYLIPLKFLERLTMKEKGWIPGRETFMITGESNSDQRELAMDRFNNSVDAKVFFGSIKACGEGISLVGASRIIILDVHLNPSVTRQAIGRAFRPGQKKKVYTYRLVAANSPEEEDHLTCFRKELISRMWFEWNEHCGHRDFDVETIDVDKCGDLYLETPLLQEDVKVLYKR